MTLFMILNYLETGNYCDNCWSFAHHTLTTISNKGTFNKYFQVILMQVIQNY